MNYKTYDFNFNEIVFPVSLATEENTISAELQNNQVWEPYHLKQYDFLLNDNGVFIDIGSNVGINSLYAYKLKTDLTVYSIEADIATYQLLLQNTNNTPIKCFNIAISREDGIVQFTGSNTHGHITDKPDSQLPDLVNVKSYTLDSFVNTNTIKEIDLIKIDVKGYTDFVLYNSDKSLDITKSLIIEFSNQDMNRRYSNNCDINVKFKEIFDYLYEKGFKHAYYIARDNKLIEISDSNLLIGILNIYFSVGDVLFNRSSLKSITFDGFILTRIGELMCENHKRINEIHGISCSQKKHTLTHKKPFKNIASFSKKILKKGTRKTTTDNCSSTYLPYNPIYHYYNPIPDLKNIYSSKVKNERLLSNDFMFTNEFNDFCDSLVNLSHLTKKLPDYKEIDKLGLGLGYGEVEGHTLFLMIQKERPTGILEIGCGHSSEYARLSYNHTCYDTKKHKPLHICIEPYPSENFVNYTKQHDIKLITEKPQDINFKEIIDQLGEKPLFFIDTTHVLRADGDLHHILIKLLPKVPAGCLVHFHDIFLPWPIFHLAGQEDNPHFSFAWNETIALASLLANSNAWSVVHPGYLFAIDKPDLYGKIIPKFLETKQIGSAFWILKK